MENGAAKDLNFLRGSVEVTPSGVALSLEIAVSGAMHALLAMEPAKVTNMRAQYLHTVLPVPPQELGLRQFWV